MLAVRLRLLLEYLNPAGVTSQLTQLETCQHFRVLEQSCFLFHSSVCRSCKFKQNAPNAIYRQNNFSYKFCFSVLHRLAQSTGTLENYFDITERNDCCQHKKKKCLPCNDKSNHISFIQFHLMTGMLQIEIVVLSHMRGGGGLKN